MKNTKYYCKMFFGPPGTGKTTLGVAFAQKAIRQGIDVYTNFPCIGAYELDTSTLGKYQYQGLCIIDEAGIDFNNRDWKKFTKDMTAYVKLHRHYYTNFIFLSQGWDDCDKKIRTICTEYYYLKKIGPVTLYRLIYKNTGIDEITKQIIDEYRKKSVWNHGLKCIWRPKWYKYFDSWDAPPLPAAQKKPWNTAPA